MAQQKPKRKKGLKKKFFEAKVPLTATKVHLYGYSPEDLEGNVITLDLSRNLRGKNLELKAKVKMDGKELVSELVSISLMQSYIRKVMRRGTDYVEDSFETTCKDAKLRIKPFMITRNRVPRSIRNEIRNIARKYLEAHTTVRTSHELFSEIMSNKLQKEMSLKIKKIYPLGLCEIRVLKVLEKIDSPKKETNKVESLEQ